MLLRISSNSCSLNLLLVRSHQEEIINVKRLIQESKSVTRVPVEPRSFHQSCRKNNAFTLSATLPSSLYNIAHSQIISINKNCSKSFLYNRYSLKETARHPARVIYIAADDRVFAARFVDLNWSLLSPGKITEALFGLTFCCTTYWYRGKAEKFQPIKRLWSISIFSYLVLDF